MHATLSSGEHVRIVFKHQLTPRFRSTGMFDAAGKPILEKIEYPKRGGPPQAVTICAIVAGAKEATEVLASGETRCAWLDDAVNLTEREADLVGGLREAASIASGKPHYGSDLERFVAIRRVCDQAASTVLDVPPRAEPYEKEIGRQHALERAIETLSPEDQGAILKAYYERPRRRSANQITCICGEVLNSAAEALAHFTGHQEWQKPKEATS
jgi:hypothetical protein